MRMESFWGYAKDFYYDPEKWYYNDGFLYAVEGGALYISDAGEPVIVETWDSGHGEFAVVIEVLGRRWETEWKPAGCGEFSDAPDQSVLSSAAGSMGVTGEDLGRMLSEAFRAASLAAVWQLAEESKAEGGANP